MKNICMFFIANLNKKIIIKRYTLKEKDYLLALSLTSIITGRIIGLLPVNSLINGCSSKIIVFLKSV